jgi:hypothetical protein
MPLIEKNGCIFDAEQLPRAIGYQDLDPVGQEAFVNHLHIDGDDRQHVAEQRINLWAAEMRSRWPGKTFRLYRQISESEIVIRFHVVRPGLPNWCESGVEIVTVSGIDVNSLPREIVN